MTVNALLGQGAELWMATSDTGTGKQRLSETTSIAGPTLASDQIDVTSHDSIGGYREKIAGLTDPGELTFDIFYVPDKVDHMAILTALNDKAVRHFQLLLPPEPGIPGVPTGIWQLKGTITGFEADIPVDDAMKASITITLAGQPNFAATEWA